MATLLDRAADRMKEWFPHLPWTVRISFEGRSRTFGSGPERAEWVCRTREALERLAIPDLRTFLDHYVVGEVDFNGDIYGTVGCRRYIRQESDWLVGFRYYVRHAWTYFIPSSVQRKLNAIQTHYDLPAEFIESYLDKRTRAYSCAMWKEPLSDADGEPLEDAQYHKFDMAAGELEIQPEDRFVDIGCGYGYMTHLAETKFGCKHALGITLSKNQVERGFSKNMKLMHYLELKPEGQFDKIYTCGMVSHLDHSEIEQYYRHIFGLLRSGGRAWVHAIVPPVMAKGHTNYTTVSGNFSQKYVFPDHFQFPVHVHLKLMERTGFCVRNVYYRYGHYAKTLRHWYRRFVENLPTTRKLISPVTERAWHLFLTYASVMDGANGSVVKQIVVEKP